ncbi:glycosyltransferase family 4 protein [Pseudochrobactrum kiredjianiae]|uniref:Glycosyltransferase family 4 protein n=1 Tax=Pseudochrobactrum kiredjianiae TaxID=386305 RepID=A0ABW3V1Y5_9HYPH|nr:glycosyltransferase family 4 protein [Pseudochrobactrum kiredjianiae]MDM7853282.1 glycosyltransferase family 4 protein [Pseudochrobactrum kiredjianiae]
MKVVICISSDSERSGGSFRVAEVAIRSLLRLGVNVHAVIGYGPGGRIKRLLGEKCHLIDSSSWKDIGGWLRFRRLLKTLAPDIIHFASASNWMIASSIGLKSVRIMHQHFRPNIEPNGAKHIRNIKLKMIGAHRIVAISYGAARQLVTLCGISELKVAIIHNAVDKAYLNPKPLRLDDTKRLGMAVRVVEDKGIEDALSLLALMPENFFLTVAGDGAALPRLKILAEQKGLSGRVEWLGSVENIEAFYSKIDYYLYLSWYEGFGLSVAEAMSCEIPIVGLIGDGEIAEPEYPLVTEENSLLVPRSSRSFRRETDAATFLNLRNAIVDLDDQKHVRDALIKNAKAWVEQRFSSDLYGRRLHQLYTETLKWPGGFV